MRFVVQPADEAQPEAVTGRRLRELREGRQWSQEQVAEEMRTHGWSWHQTTCAKTEAGTRPLRLNEVRSLAEIFDVRFEVLASWDSGHSKEWLNATSRVSRAQLAERKAAAAREAAERTLRQAVAAHEAARQEVQHVEEEVRRVLEAEGER